MQSRAVKEAQALVAFAVREEIMELKYFGHRPKDEEDLMAKIYLGSGSGITSKVSTFLEGTGQFANVWEGDRIRAILGLPLSTCTRTCFGADGAQLRQTEVAGVVTDMTGCVLKDLAESRLRDAEKLLDCWNRVVARGRFAKGSGADDVLRRTVALYWEEAKTAPPDEGNSDALGSGDDGPPVSTDPSDTKDKVPIGYAFFVLFGPYARYQWNCTESRALMSDGYAYYMTIPPKRVPRKLRGELSEDSDLEWPTDRKKKKRDRRKAAQEPNPLHALLAESNRLKAMLEMHKTAFQLAVDPIEKEQHRNFILELSTSAYTSNWSLSPDI